MEKNNKIDIKTALNYLSFPIIILFLLYLSAFLYSKSVDLAHHYALVSNITEFGKVYSAFGNLGEMAYYPNLSHYFASIVATICNSNIEGLAIVSAFFMFIMLFIISFFMQEYKPTIYITFFILIILFGLSTNFYHAFYGYEAVISFFYPQLVAEALALIVLYCYKYFKNSSYGIIFICLSLFFIAFCHLLPAIQLLGFCYFLLLYNFIKDRKIEKISIIITLLFTIAFIFHPSLTAMKSIAHNNGYLYFPFMKTPLKVDYITLITLSILSYALSLFFLFTKKINYTNISIKLLSLFSLSSTSLMLLQFILTFFDYGSAYAVKKYIFTLFTISTIQFFIIISVFVSSILDKYISIQKLPKIFIATLFSIIILVIQTNKSHFLNVSNLKNTEQELTLYKSYFLEKKYNHKSVYLDKNSVLSYMFSIGVLNHPRDKIMASVLENKNILRSKKWYRSKNLFICKYNFKNNIRQILKPIYLYGKPYCTFSDNDYTLFAQKKIKNIFKNGIYISENPYILKTGWNKVESNGVWSSDRVATVSINYLANKKINNISFISNSWYIDKNVTVKANKTNCGTITILKNMSKEYRVKCNTTFKDKLKIDFIVDNYDISPKKLNISKDARNLGIRLSKIKLD